MRLKPVYFGVSGSWNNMTPAARQRRIEALSKASQKAWDTFSPSQREQRANAVSAGLKHFWETRSPESRLQTTSRISASVKKQWESCSSEERRQRCNAISIGKRDALPTRTTTRQPRTKEFRALKQLRLDRTKQGDFDEWIFDPAEFYRHSRLSGKKFDLAKLWEMAHVLGFNLISRKESEAIALKLFNQEKQCSKL